MSTTAWCRLGEGPAAHLHEAGHASSFAGFAATPRIWRQKLFALRSLAILLSVGTHLSRHAYEGQEQQCNTVCSLAQCCVTCAPLPSHCRFEWRAAAHRPARLGVALPAAEGEVAGSLRGCLKRASASPQTVGISSSWRPPHGVPSRSVRKLPSRNVVRVLGSKQSTCGA